MFPNQCAGTLHIIRFVTIDAVAILCFAIETTALTNHEALFCDVSAHGQQEVEEQGDLFSKKKSFIFIHSSFIFCYRSPAICIRDCAHGQQKIEGDLFWK